jgi:hypothetical protein
LEETKQQSASESSKFKSLFRPTQRLERLEVFLETLHVGFQVHFVWLILVGPDFFRLLCVGRHFIISYAQDTKNHAKYYGAGSLSTSCSSPLSFPDKGDILGITHQGCAGAHAEGPLGSVSKWIPKARGLCHVKI